MLTLTLRSFSRAATPVFEASVGLHPAPTGEEISDREV